MQCVEGVNYARSVVFVVALESFIISFLGRCSMKDTRCSGAVRVDYSVQIRGRVPIRNIYSSFRLWGKFVLRPSAMVVYCVMWTSRLCLELFFFVLDCYINAHFTPAVYKYLLGLPCEMADLELDDASLFR